MITFFLIYIAITIFCIIGTHQYYKKYKEKASNGIMWMVIAIYLFVSIAVCIVPPIQTQYIVQDAEEVAQVMDASIYYDVDNDTYFAVKKHDWNITKLSYRVEINQEYAVYLKEAYAAINHKLNEDKN